MLMRRVNSSRNCSYSGVVVVSSAFAILGSLVTRHRAAGRALPRTGAGPAGIVLFPDSIVRHASSRWDRRSGLVPDRWKKSERENPHEASSDTGARIGGARGCCLRLGGCG